MHMYRGGWNCRAARCVTRDLLTFPNGNSFPDTQYIQYRKPQTENEIYQVEMAFSRYSWWVRVGTGSQKSYISVRNLLAS